MFSVSKFPSEREEDIYTIQHIRVFNVLMLRANSNLSCDAENVAIFIQVNTMYKNMLA